MKKKTTVIIKAPVTQKIVAELWCGENLLGELAKEGRKFHLEIYSPDKSQKSWKLELDDFLQLLGEAQQELNKAAGEIRA